MEDVVNKLPLYPHPLVPADKIPHQVFGNCVGGGVNLFDTAEVYGLGRSEYLCGKFRRDYKGPDKSGIVIGESWEARRSRTYLDSLGAYVFDTGTSKKDFSSRCRTRAPIKCSVGNTVLIPLESRLECGEGLCTYFRLLKLVFFQRCSEKYVKTDQEMYRSRDVQEGCRLRVRVPRAQLCLRWMDG